MLKLLYDELIGIPLHAFTLLSLTDKHYVTLVYLIKYPLINNKVLIQDTQVNLSGFGTAQLIYNDNMSNFGYVFYCRKAKTQVHKDKLVLGNTKDLVFDNSISTLYNDDNLIILDSVYNKNVMCLSNHCSKYIDESRII